MKVMLLADMDRLGKRGDIVDVRGGYARNFLLPRRLAVRPTPGAKKEVELARKRLEQIEKARLAKAEADRALLAKVPRITIEARANESGVLYGSVTPTAVVDALRPFGIKIEAAQVDLRDGIKQIGDFEITIRLHKGVEHPLKVKVVASAEIKLEGAEEPTPLGGEPPKASERETRA